jgi:predicted nucleic acid-binding protein
LLPTIGISVKQVAPSDAARLWNLNFELAISEITIFELCAKSAKYVAKGELDPARVVRGLDTITNDDSIVKLPLYERGQLSTSFRLRDMIGDFIDCIIISAALTHSDGLITEDRDLHELKRSKEFLEIARELNPKFEIRKLSDIDE